MNDVDRENLTERIQIVEALLVVAENPAKLLEVCAAVSGDHTSAVEAVADAFQLTDLQASAVLDMQIRRFTPEQIQLLGAELSDFRERFAEQLMVHTGARVTAFGHLERDVRGRLVLWAAFPWEPHRWPYRTTGGDIRIELAEPSSGEAIAELVRVEGIWTGSVIAQAIVENVDSAVVASWCSGLGEATPTEIGSEKFVELSSMLARAGAAPSLSTGGTVDAILQHVLYVTPGLVDACKGLPVRVDVFAAIAPS